MDKEVIMRSYAQAENAVARLAEAALAAAIPNDIVRDALIQRFEFSYELTWKLFRKLHILRGLERDKVRRAFESIAEAGAAGWLKDRALWERMIRDRNFTSHEYDEVAADAIALRVRAQYLPELQRALGYIKMHYIDRDPFQDWKDRAEKN